VYAGTGGLLWLAGLAIVSLALRGQAAGEEQGWPWWCQQWRALRQPCPCCPDDYDKKKLPVVCPARWEGCNDYDKKKLPIVHPLDYCGPDDYCKKKYPFTGPCYPPWYTCGVPAGNQGSCDGANARQ
jgi:hypothetical protein